MYTVITENNIYIYIYIYIYVCVCRWLQQHEYIEKINMQAVINATNQEDEFIKEFLITHEKVTELHNLILNVNYYY